MRIVLAPSLLSVAYLIVFECNAAKEKYDKVEYINDIMVKKLCYISVHISNFTREEVSWSLILSDVF